MLKIASPAPPEEQVPLPCPRGSCLAETGLAWEGSGPEAADVLIQDGAEAR